MTCDQVPDAAWLNRFEGRCYFYPSRDCPGWTAGQMCGRIAKRIPGDAEVIDSEV